MTPAPIALFVYKRPRHAARVVESLQRNPEAAATSVYVFCDAARDELDREAVSEVRALASGLTGFRSVTVIERERNLGLARSIVDGVGRLCEEHRRVIVLEDDLLPSPHFLAYMNAALERYEHEARIVSIHAYCYPVAKPLPETFLLRGADCWGWATWRRGWEVYEPEGRMLLSEIKARGLEYAFDLDGSYPYTQMLEDAVAGRNDSWAVRWYASAFLRGLLTLYPGVSQVQNIGVDGSGMHVGATNAFTHRAWGRLVRVDAIPIEESAVAREAFVQFLRSTRPSLLRRALTRVRRAGAAAQRRE